MFIIVFFGALLIGLPYYFLTGQMDAQLLRKGGFFGLVMLGGWLVALHTIVDSSIRLVHCKKLTGDALKAKAEDGVAGFWVGVFKWAFFIALAGFAWYIFVAKFLPASSTYKLLVGVGVILAGIMLLLLRISEQLKAKR